MKILRPLSALTLCLTFTYAYADAYSANQRCQSKAGEAYDACLRNNQGSCDARLDRDSDRCQRTYSEMLDLEARGARYDSSGRFNPTPIPQRPGYVLPGMR